MGDASKESHLERTADEPRHSSLHTVVLAAIEPVGSSIRVLRLEIADGEQSPEPFFRPGQWIDTYCPGIARAGGFTLTSTPSQAAAAAPGTTSIQPYLELAVRRSPDSEAALWLWQPADVILGRSLQVRVGGRFVYPPCASPSAAPSSAPLPPPKHVVFVAGGVGINPLMSMLSYIGEQQQQQQQQRDQQQPTIAVLYSWRQEGLTDTNTATLSTSSPILFLDRLAALFSGSHPLQGSLRLFLTGASPAPSLDGTSIPCERRRITTADLDAAVHATGTAAARENTYVYICGVPTMTDAFAAHLTVPSTNGRPLLPPQNVLFEKWW